MSSSPPSSSQVEVGGSSSSVTRRRSRSRRRRRRDHLHLQPPPPYEQVWPEHFIEALALHVAIDASSSIGRLASAPAISLLFQVCSTWRAVSRSSYLWQSLTRQIYNRTTLTRATWRDEFIYGHSTARNFQLGRCVHTTLLFDDDHDNVPINLVCLRLTLSDHHIAAGFSDGSVRLFQLDNFRHLRTFRPLRRDRLGVFSCAVTGIILPVASSVVFASLDGDIHVSVVDGWPDRSTRRAHLGDVVNDGTLVDFTGSNRFWVGLYAGLPGRAIHIWDGETEQLLSVGGLLTDPVAVTGWHLLNALTTSESIGRVRMVGAEHAVACTAHRALLFDLNEGVSIGEEEPRRGIVVGSVDATEGAYVSVDRRGVGSVRMARSMEELCRFPLRGGAHVRGLLGAMNQGYVLMCARDVVSVWDSVQGEYLYGIGERVVEATYLVASDRYVAASQGDTSIHLWDFGGMN